LNDTEQEAAAIWGVDKADAVPSDGGISGSEKNGVGFGAKGFQIAIDDEFVMPLEDDCDAGLDDQGGISQDGDFALNQVWGTGLGPGAGNRTGGDDSLGVKGGGGKQQERPEQPL